MSWIVSSLLMFVSSIAFYLSVKKLQLLGVDKRTLTIANNVFPSGVFLVATIMLGLPIIYPVVTLLSIFVLKTLFNYIGTIAGYKSMEDAPNAGYSLVIQKSYAVYTLFASVILFGSEISLRKFIISGFILICASLVAFTKSTSETKLSYKWVLYAILAMFCFGSISLSSKYLATLGINPTSQIFWSSSFTLLVTMMDSWRVKQKISIPNITVGVYMALLGITVCGFYYFKLISELNAPNLGYVATVNAASNAIYTILVALIFKDALSPKKLLAVTGMTVGLIMLLFT